MRRGSAHRYFFVPFFPLATGHAQKVPMERPAGRFLRRPNSGNTPEVHMTRIHVFGSSFRKHSNKSRFVYSLRFLCFNKSGASKINVNDPHQRTLLVARCSRSAWHHIPPLSFVIGCLFSSCAFHELQSTPLHESIAVDSIARLREASKGALLVGRVDGLRCVLFDPLQESSDRDRIQLELKASLICTMVVN